MEKNTKKSHSEGELPKRILSLFFPPNMLVFMSKGPHMPQQFPPAHPKIKKLKKKKAERERERERTLRGQAGGIQLTNCYSFMG